MAGRGVEVLPGIHAIAAGGVQVYLVDDPGRGLTLVDAGSPGAAGRILACLRSLGRAPGELQRIVITHADVDHVGGLRSLVEATGARVLAGAAAVPFIRGRRGPPHLRGLRRLAVALVDAVARRPAGVDATLADGEVVDVRGGLRVLATPGHTVDHLCFFLEREGVLFAGDLFRNVKGLELFPRSTWDPEAQRRSARRALALVPRVICPGHGRPWLEAADPGGLEAVAQAVR